ncbi:MAG: DUF4438 domain-containing protein [Ruminococcaceae bacterium]|nr:DUF4438 domain-containing protein [Oscillospiraceae bacterium]
MKPTLNTEQLVIQSVIGAIRSPAIHAPYRVDHAGIPFTLPGTGGITYNVKVGDSVFGMQGDHLEPGVTVQNKDTTENSALNLLACVGNTARVVSGEARGEAGIVTGKHGGVEHLLVWFSDDTLDKLVIGDKIQVKAVGQGAQITGFEDTVQVMNLDPALYDKLGVTTAAGRLMLPVAATVPAHLLGSGIGSPNARRGDIDIMTADTAELAAHGLGTLRFGDIVLLQDCDTSYGRGYLKGAVTVGVVVHSNCLLAGHGPGVTALFTAKTPVIQGILTPGANIADYLEL